MSQSPVACEYKPKKKNHQTAVHCTTNMFFASKVFIRKLGVAHAPGMPGTFSPPRQVCDPDMHHGTLTSGFLWSRWLGCFYVRIISTIAYDSKGTVLCYLFFSNKNSNKLYEIQTYPIIRNHTWVSNKQWLVLCWAFHDTGRNELEYSMAEKWYW